MAFTLDKDLCLKLEAMKMAYDIGHGNNKDDNDPEVTVRVIDLETKAEILRRTFKNMREDLAVTQTVTEAVGMEKPKPLTEQVKEANDTIAKLKEKLAKFTAGGNRGGRPRKDVAAVETPVETV